MKHFYQNIGVENMFTYPKLYRNMVKKFGDGAKFIEIGSWKGQSAVFMAVEIINSLKNIEFYCVDIWKGNGIIDSYENYLKTCNSKNKSNKLFNIFIKNIEPVKHIIKPIRKTSIAASKKFSDEYFDFIFIDASHEYKEFKQDLIAWYPKIKKGGVFAGHDYKWGGVERALREFFSELPKFNIKEQCWVINK